MKEWGPPALFTNLLKYRNTKAVENYTLIAFFIYGGGIEGRPIGADGSAFAKGYGGTSRRGIDGVVANLMVVSQPLVVHGMGSKDVDSKTVFIGGMWLVLFFRALPCQHQEVCGGNNKTIFRKGFDSFGCINYLEQGYVQLIAVKLSGFAYG